jgi:hypothetical protein
MHCQMREGAHQHALPNEGWREVISMHRRSGAGPDRPRSRAHLGRLRRESARGDGREEGLDEGL